MAARANWKGVLKVGEVACAVALYTGASTSDRIAFHTLNRETGNRVRRRYVDAETAEVVERDDQVKGFELPSGEVVTIEPEEAAAAVPDSDKTLAIDAFIACAEIDDVYFDKPYYLAPADEAGIEAFALIRDGLAAENVAALARTVLFRRERTVLIRPHGLGMVATTLNFNYEVRSSEEAFRGLPKTKISGEMLDLAKYIIGTKRGSYDPAAFDDRYEAALAELVKAKLEGRKIAPRKPKAPAKVSDLMEALRRSAGMKGAAEKDASKTDVSKPPARKASTTKAKSATTKSTTAKSSSPKAATSKTAKPKTAAAKARPSVERRKAS